MNADLAMQRALDRMHKVGFDNISEQDKTLACVWSFDSKVSNGGLKHFFKSAEGDLAYYVPKAFRAVGLIQLAEVAEQANAVFGPEGVPTERNRRIEILRDLPTDSLRIFDELEARYFSDPTELDDPLEKYLTKMHALSESPEEK
jgi:hypothetical protein